MLRDLTTLTDHRAVSEMVDTICDKTQNMDRNFFRVEAAYFLSKMASSMRATVKTKDRGTIPVNMYALALATSGFGKGYSVSIFENSFLKGFRDRFMGQSFDDLAERNMLTIANKRAAYRNTDPAKEEEKLKKQFLQAGAYPFTFDSGTTPAVKQLREKLLIAGAGSINLQIDEIGSNLVNNEEILNTYLELYDLGKTKTKLTKNTSENNRGQDLDGSTPANMLLFGTPSKLLDGGGTEDRFFEMLQTGYARRCIFAWGQRDRAANDMTPEEIYARLTSKGNTQTVMRWAAKFTKLADPLKHGWEMEVPDNVAIELLRYKIQCEKFADTLPEHCEMQKAEISHRYFKTLKLAGVFSFVDESPIVTMDNLYHAIHLVEDSGRDFEQLLTREKAYAKLARYIAAYDQELTHADLNEALPFYKASNQARNEMMTLATAWGYKNNIMIKKTFAEGIEFFSGETLAETSLEAVDFSCSTDFASDYEPQTQHFENLHRLTGAPGWHWANHRFENQHRKSDNVIPGFNMIVLDLDGTAPREFVHDMMRDYTFMTYTTKRHQAVDPQNPQIIGPDRFRLIIPMKYQLQLDKADYRQFMENITEWLPFDIDDGANQRERKWLTNPSAEHHYNLDGDLLDPIRFIPKTSKNLTHQKQMTELKDLNNFERWFAERMVMGNRNNQMIRFAMALSDNGMQYADVEQRVLMFNSKLANSLSETELRTTVLKSVAKKMSGVE